MVVSHGWIQNNALYACISVNSEEDDRIGNMFNTCGAIIVINDINNENTAKKYIILQYASTNLNISIDEVTINAT